MTQEEFMQNLVTNKTQVNVYLVNGVKLQGIIESADDKSLTISGNRDNLSQLIFKHAVSTIQVMR